MFLQRSVFLYCWQKTRCCVFKAKVVTRTRHNVKLRVPLHCLTCLLQNSILQCRPGSSVGITTGYGLDGPGIESRWGTRFSAPVQTIPGAHPASCTMDTGFFSEGKSGQRVTLTPSSAVGHERVELYLYSPMGRTACTEPQCLYKGALYLTLPKVRVVMSLKGGVCNT
jgi:hypothetical protein